MEFVKVGNKGKFHSAVYHRFLQSIVSCFAILNYRIFFMFVIVLELWILHIFLICRLVLRLQLIL